MDHPDIYCGQCFCGAVQFTLSREPAGMGYCHCDSCRRWSASPVNAFTLWKPEALRVTHGANDISAYNRTTHRYRKWRRFCGGHLFTEHPGFGLIDVYAAVVDDFPYEPGVHVRYPESVLPLRAACENKETCLEKWGPRTSVPSNNHRVFPIRFALPDRRAGTLIKNSRRNQICTATTRLCLATMAFEEFSMSTVDSASTSIPDFAAVKARHQVAWSTGNYAVVGTTLQIVGENLCEALDLRAGSRVLDVAAGNGNATLAAARRWCDVTSTDYVASLLDSGRARAQAEGLAVQFQEADAEALPFADATFDIVMSTFGVMFTPNQEKAAAELVRVCKPGGRIGLANWTPESFIGQLFKTIGKYIPPPAGVKSPALWGAKACLQELFGDSARKITAINRDFMFRYRSPAHFIDVFRTFYGPMNKAFAALDGEPQAAAFHRDLMALIENRNRSNDATLVLPSEYLEVVIERR